MPEKVNETAREINVFKQQKERKGVAGMIIPYEGNMPDIGKNVFIADGAKIIGKVSIGEYSSVWFNCVLRGDSNFIKIGKRSNIQDLSVVHGNRAKTTTIEGDVVVGDPTTIEDDVLVGHSCVIHGCTLRKGSSIGMGTVILGGAEIGEYSMVGAGSLIPARKIFPANSLILGSPARVVRELTLEEIEAMSLTLQYYVKQGQVYLNSKP